jgi:hypothetical protein
MFKIEIVDVMTADGTFINLNDAIPKVLGENLSEKEVLKIARRYSRYIDSDDFDKLIPEGESTYVMVLGPGMRRRKLFVRRMGA